MTENLISSNASPPETFSAFYSFGEKIDNNTYINLPKEAYEGFKYIYSLTEKKKCKAEAIHKERRHGIQILKLWFHLNSLILEVLNPGMLQNLLKH